MRLTIKTDDTIYIETILEFNRVCVNIDGIRPECILKQVDIDVALNYYGITELLDSIGENEIRLHLNSGKETGNTTVK